MQQHLSFRVFFAAMAAAVLAVFVPVGMGNAAPAPTAAGVPAFPSCLTALRVAHSGAVVLCQWPGAAPVSAVNVPGGGHVVRGGDVGSGGSSADPANTDGTSGGSGGSGSNGGNNGNGGDSKGSNGGNGGSGGNGGPNGVGNGKDEGKNK